MKRKIKYCERPFKGFRLPLVYEEGVSGVEVYEYLFASRDQRDFFLRLLYLIGDIAGVGSYETYTLVDDESVYKYAKKLDSEGEPLIYKYLREIVWVLSEIKSDFFAKGDKRNWAYIVNPKKKNMIKDVALYCNDNEKYNLKYDKKISDVTETESSDSTKNTHNEK